MSLTPQGASLGLTVSDVSSQLRAAYEGQVVQSYSENDAEIEVRVRLPKAERDASASLDYFPIVLPNGDRVRSITEEAHAGHLTRETVTAAVHYIRFEFTPEQIESFAVGPVRLEIEQPDYLEAVELSEATHAELLGDLRD